MGTVASAGTIMVPSSSSLSVSTAVLVSSGHLVRSQLVHREEEETAAQVAAAKTQRHRLPPRGPYVRWQEERRLRHCPKIPVIREARPT